MPYVLSKMVADVTYQKGGWNGHQYVVSDSVTIKGGAGMPIMDFSPSVMTEISDQQYSWLIEDNTFKTHLKNGAVIIAERKLDEKKDAGELVRDASAIPTEEELNEEMDTTLPKPSESRRTRGRRGNA